LIRKLIWFYSFYLCGLQRTFIFQFAKSYAITYLLVMLMMKHFFEFISSFPTPPSSIGDPFFLNTLLKHTLKMCYIISNFTKKVLSEVIVVDKNCCWKQVQHGRRGTQVEKIKSYCWKWSWHIFSSFDCGLNSKMSWLWFCFDF